RIADRDHPVADPRLAGVLEVHIREGAPAGLDLDHRQVGALVAADDGGLELALVLEHHLDGLGVLDDVVVGDDEAVGGDEEARAGDGAQEIAGLLRGHLTSVPWRVRRYPARAILKPRFDAPKRKGPQVTIGSLWRGEFEHIDPLWGGIMSGAVVLRQAPDAF